MPSDMKQGTKLTLEILGSQTEKRVKQGRQSEREKGSKQRERAFRKGKREQFDWHD